MRCNIQTDRNSVHLFIYATTKDETVKTTKKLLKYDDPKVKLNNLH